MNDELINILIALSTHAKTNKFKDRMCFGLYIGIDCEKQCWDCPLFQIDIKSAYWLGIKSIFLSIKK